MCLIFIKLNSSYNYDTSNMNTHNLYGYTKTLETGQYQNLHGYTTLESTQFQCIVSAHNAQWQWEAQAPANGPSTSYTNLVTYLDIDVAAVVSLLSFG